MWLAITAAWIAVTLAALAAIWRRYGHRYVACLFADALLFWFSVVIFFPILLWCLSDSQKRCLHEILAGMVVMNRR